MQPNCASMSMNTTTGSLPRSTVDALGQRQPISFNRSLTDDCSPKSNVASHDMSANVSTGALPGSPCTWRKYLPMSGGPLRLVNHRISAHPNGPAPVELNFIKSRPSRTAANCESYSESGHLSDTECDRKPFGSTNREPLSYGQMLCSPMVSRRTMPNAKFQSLEKNLKLLKPSLNVSSIETRSSCSTSAGNARPTHLLRRQASFVGETLTNRSAAPIESKPFGSSWSLASAATAPPDSLTAKVDRPVGHEMRKLKRELQVSHQKVGSLTCQLNTNAQMVSAYEQSLSAMTARVAQLSSLSQQKDAEMARLMRIIDRLGGGNEALEADDVCDSPPEAHDSAKEGRTSCSLIRRHTFTSGSEELRVASGRHARSGVVDRTDGERTKKACKSLKSLKPVSFGVPPNEPSSLSGKNSWLRSSLTKAFRKQRSETSSTPDPIEPVTSQVSSRSSASKAVESAGVDGETITIELRRQLRDTENQLTEARLESLNGAHQLDSLRELVEQLRAQLTNVQQENERLCKFMQHKSLASSKSSMHSISSGALNALSQTSSTGGGGSNNAANGVAMRVHSTQNSLPVCLEQTSHDTVDEPPRSPFASPSGAAAVPISSNASTTTTHLARSFSVARHETSSKASALVASASCSSCSTNSSAELCGRHDSQFSSNMLHDLIGESDEPLVADDQSISWSSSCDLVQADTGRICSVRLPDWLDAHRPASSSSLTSSEHDEQSPQCLGRFRLRTDTTWTQLDNKVRARIAQYLALVDPDRSVGLTLHSFVGYRVGDESTVRSFASSQASSHRSSSARSSFSLRNSFGSDGDGPSSTCSADLPSSGQTQFAAYPFAHLAERPLIHVQLASRLDHFCLQTHIPRCTLLRFLAVLGDHRRLLLHGPTGSAKSHLARLLAQFLVSRTARDVKQSFTRGDLECSVATCVATSSNENEMQANFASMADQWQICLESNRDGASDTLPNVLVIDDLHHWKHPDQTLAPLFSMSIDSG
jgi:neuron navigator 2